MARKVSQTWVSFDSKRDSYGFTVRPQHQHRYREYADIYKEEEEERLHKWKSFLERQTESARAHPKTETSNFLEQQSESTGAYPLTEDDSEPLISGVKQLRSDPDQEVNEKGNDFTEENPKDSEVTTNPEEVSEGGGSSDEKLIAETEEAIVPKKAAQTIQHTKSREVKTWADISPSLSSIERMMSVRVKKRINMKDERATRGPEILPPIDEAMPFREETEDGDEQDSNYRELTDDSAHADASPLQSTASGEESPEPFFPWKEELEFLVQGGVPKDLRGEVWQAFVGVRTRRVERYYQDLLGTNRDACNDKGHDGLSSGHNGTQDNGKRSDLSDKWKKQIEKDLPRTFPGHPALNDRGRNSLRRVLLAYARHNPAVGYCQAMNFFAGLLLLMMPEENAFWTLVGIMDEYCEGYFSEDMIESQIDQLVFEDLMREKFPKLVNHLDYLGVQVAWISGPWFLSIFVNMLPWESVLRVWDVLLFEGNRVMLFRTALALMDLYGPAVVTTKDAGDAVILLQTLAGSTFDSSQLVLTACMGFLNITEDKLQELRQKHRPAILAVVEERAKGSRVFKDPKGLATKLYSFKHNPEAIVRENKSELGSGDKTVVGDVSALTSESPNLDEFLKGIDVDSEVGALPDLHEQVVWLKVELCRLLEEKRSALLRAEELESALMELVKQDNRRQLSARVEQLEQEVAELKQTLADKSEGEKAMVQVLMKVEQEQRVTEDARRFAEQDAAAQRYAVNVLQEKYDKAMSSLAETEKRAVMAESMLEATLQYQSGQSKALSSPVAPHPDNQSDAPARRGLLSFALGWQNQNKGKPSNDAETKPKSDESNTSSTTESTIGH